MPVPGPAARRARGSGPLIPERQGRRCMECRAGGARSAGSAALRGQGWRRTGDEAGGKVGRSRPALDAGGCWERLNEGVCEDKGGFFKRGGFSPDRPLISKICIDYI
jgi:hypothetical protein